MSYTKVIQTGNQYEFYEYEKIPQRSSNVLRSHRVSKSNTKLSKLLAPRRGDNLYNARRRLIRLVKSNLGSSDPPSFVTLTTTGTLATCDVWSAFRQFYRRIKNYFGSSLKFVAVIEFQPVSGFIHVHALIWGIPYEVIKKERRSRFLQREWQMGFVDCIATDGHPAIAGYLAKYMRKGLSDERLLGKRAYSSSRNVLRPVLRTFDESFEDISEYFIDPEKVSPVYERIYETQWLGKGHYRYFE